MELKFLELELHSKLEFQNSAIFLYFLPNTGIWPFWPHVYIIIHVNLTKQKDKGKKIGMKVSNTNDKKL